jgi:hypothetical protein
MRVHPELVLDQAKMTLALTVELGGGLVVVEGDGLAVRDLGVGQRTLRGVGGGWVGGG